MLILHPIAAHGGHRYQRLAGGLIRAHPRRKSIRIWRRPTLQSECRAGSGVEHSVYLSANQIGKTDAVLGFGEIALEAGNRGIGRERVWS